MERKQPITSTLDEQVLRSAPVRTAGWLAIGALAVGVVVVGAAALGTLAVKQQVRRTLRLHRREPAEAQERVGQEPAEAEQQAEDE